MLWNVSMAYRGSGSVAPLDVFGMFFNLNMESLVSNVRALLLLSSPFQG